ncbi:zinc finger protein 62 homolog [Chironomus tepperi]|uniref:zinc finger protein 62 homolog n=1 Tax=Chironomus tepperi TaxID=113505 RepID=UPI00391F121F
MSSKITNFFKIKPKADKLDEEVSSSSNMRECKVNLKDIKHQFGNNELKLFEEISLKERKNCKKGKNICKFCGKKFNLESNLNQHMKNIHPNEFDLFNCEICTGRFYKKQSLEVHMKKKHPDGQIEKFECDFDGKIFKTKNKLYTHMTCHLSLVECQICHKMLKFRSIHSHMTNFHVFENQFQCKICDKQFKSKRYLSVHEKIHNKQFKCEICNKMFSFNSHLDDHKKTIHENPGSFECEICGKKFCQKSNLKSHQKTHNEDRPKSLQCQRLTYQKKINLKMSAKITNFFKIKPKVVKIDEEVSKSPKIRECQVVIKDIKHQFGSNELELFKKISSNQRNRNEKSICKYCGKKLSSEDCLKMHMKYIHPNEFDLFNCGICNRRFFKKQSLEVHMKKKHPDEQIEKFECDFDGKIFKTKKELYSHMGCHFSLIKCQICHKMLKYNYMKSHLRNFHATDKKFQCKICDKQFKSKYYLNRHEKLHNKQFKCEICNKMFSINSHLDDHKKTIHENPGSFECEICGKKFNLKHHVQNHQKTHNKNRPKSFQCQRCDYATDYKSTFKKHQKSHERQDIKFASMKNPLKCEKCPTFCKDKKNLYVHMRQVHPKELFQCDLCAKFIKTKPDLVKHIRNHIRKIANI